MTVADLRSSTRQATDSVARARIRRVNSTERIDVTCADQSPLRPIDHSPTTVTIAASVRAIRPRTGLTSAITSRGTEKPTNKAIASPSLSTLLRVRRVPTC
jgi:hypothetical protein